MRGKQLIAAGLAVLMVAAFLAGAVSLIDSPATEVPVEPPEELLEAQDFPGREDLTAEELSQMVILTGPLESITSTEVCVVGMCLPIDRSTHIDEGLGKGDAIEIGYPISLENGSETPPFDSEPAGSAYYVTRAP